MKRATRLFWIGMLVCSFIGGPGFGAQAEEIKIKKEPQNLVPNPGFEKGLAPWFPGKGVIDTEEFHSGAASVKIAIPDGATLGWSGGYSDRIKVEPNVEYKVSGWMQAEDIHGGRGAGINVATYDAEDKTIGNNNIISGIQGTFPWKKFEKVITVPANVCFVRIGQSFMAYGTVWYDDFSLTKLEKEEQAEETKIQVTEDVKTGPVTTPEIKKKEPKNLMLNPGFEKGLQAWYPARGVIDTEEFHSGAASLKFTVPDGATLGWSGGYSDDIRVEPDAEYKISGWIQGTDLHGGRGATISFAFYDAEREATGGAHLTEGLFGTFPWKKLEKVIKIPAHVVSMKIGQAFMGYGTVWYDDFSVTKVEKEE